MPLLNFSASTFCEMLLSSLATVMSLPRISIISATPGPSCDKERGKCITTARSRKGTLTPLKFNVKEVTLSPLSTCRNSFICLLKGYNILNFITPRTALQESQSQPTQPQTTPGQHTEIQYLQNSPTFLLTQQQTHTNRIPHERPLRLLHRKFYIPVIMQLLRCLIHRPHHRNTQTMNGHHFDPNHDDPDKPVTLHA
uniref:Uncharacterized protein n=2 Tax=Timema TaxID=61471 RepID=A0A7R9F3I6_9NEOP|nr:unnamed protein product [Timema bartmani]